MPRFLVITDDDDFDDATRDLISAPTKREAEDIVYQARPAASFAAAVSVDELRAFAAILEMTPEGPGEKDEDIFSTTADLRQAIIRCMQPDNDE